MSLAAILSYAIAAILGLVMLRYVLRRKETPKGYAILHGIFAIAGVVFLLLFSLRNPEGFLPLSIFLVAATLGLLLFHRDLTNRPMPRTLALTHGLVAVTAFMLLLGMVVF